MELNADAIPIHPGAKKDGVSLAWSGGEDYELLVCGPASLPGLTWVGEVVAGEGVEWIGAPPGAAAWRGFEH